MAKKKTAFHHSNPNCLISRTVNILLSMMDNPPTCTFIVNRCNLHINKIFSIFTHPKCLMEYWNNDINQRRSIRPTMDCCGTFTISCSQPFPPRRFTTYFKQEKMGFEKHYRICSFSCRIWQIRRSSTSSRPSLRSLPFSWRGTKESKLRLRYLDRKHHWSQK